MSIHDSESSRADENKTDSDLGITSSSHQEYKKHKESSFLDSDLSRHVISEIETQLPELIEYSLLGHQKNNITIPDLRVLQKRMQESISTHSLLDVDSLKSDFGYTDFPDHDFPGDELPDSHTHHNNREGVVSAQNNSTLPDSIRKKIGAVNSYKGMNYFNSFIESFIKFKQESYKDNRTPQAAMFYTHQTQQNVQTRIDKVNDMLNLLASRLINSLSETFAMIDSLAQMKPESWISWKEFENRKREAFFYATANITGQEQPGEAFSIGERRVKLQEDPVEIMKVNSLVNAQLWHEKKYRESLWGIAPQNGESNTTDLTDPEGVTDVSEISGDISKVALSQSGGIYHSLELLLQSVSLTENAAQRILSSNEVNFREEKSYAFTQMILLTCKKLNIILIQLMDEVKKVKPSKEALNDKASQGVIEKLYEAGKKFISPTKKPAASFKASLPLVPRFLESAHLKFERKLTGIITRKTKSFSTQEIAAILHTGVIVKDKLQHTLISLAQINQASSTLRFALQRFDSVTWLLEKQSSSSNSKMLIKELEDNKVFWQQIVVEEKRKLADLVNSKMDLSKWRQKASVLLEISDILMADTHTGESQQAINAYFIELSKFIDYIVKCESRMKTIPDKLCDYPDARDSFSDEIKERIRKLQVARSYLNIEITDLTGWEPASFSRTGMLAKGIAESHQERKKIWLAKHSGSSRTKAEEEYDAIFLKYIRNYLPFIAKQKAGGGELLMERLKIEMKNAAEGKVNYPTTMAEILMAQKSTDEMFKSWSVRRLIRKSLYASLGSFSIMPSLASLPLRIAIKCLVTHAVVTFVIDKGGKAVRLGEGSSELEASKYRKNAFEQLAIKIGVSTLPFASHAIGGAFLWEDIYKGHARDAAKNVAKQLVSELPFVALNQVVANSAEAMQQKKINEQEEIRKFFDSVLKQTRAKDKAAKSVASSVKNIKVRDEIFRLSQGEDLRQVKLSQSLLNNKFIDSFGIIQSEEYAFSHYKMSTREIRLSADATDEEILHEIAHALSAHQVAAGLKNPASELGYKVQQLDALRERAQQAYQEQGGKDAATVYYLHSPHEFIAGLYSGDSEFTAFLKSIDVNGRSLLLRVLDMLCELLGLEAEQESALTHALGLSDAIMATPVAEEMEGEQQTYYGIARGRMYSQYTNPNRNRRVKCNALPLTATSIPGGAIKNSLVSELAAMSRSDRNEWIANSSLTARYKKDLGIYLAENYYIYDRMVTGSEYFTWVQSFHPHWPRNFQSENRIVGVLRLPDSVSAGNFPTNKGFKLILKNSRGEVMFEKVYYPRTVSEKNGAWKTDIASQIEEDMLLLDENNRISVDHIHRYIYSNPVVISGAKNTEVNVFVAGENSQVKNVDFQIVDQDSSLSKRSLSTSAEGAALAARLAKMSATEREVWFQRSALFAYLKRNLGIYLAENYYIYDHMVKGSDYFKYVQNRHKQWPADFQSTNRIVGVLRLPDSVLAGDFPAGKGFKLTLKNNSDGVVFEKIYYPRPGSGRSGAWKADIASQIEEDMLIHDEVNRISVSHINGEETSAPKVVSGSSNDNLNVFVVKDSSLVESANFQFVDQSCTLSLPEITSREAYSSLASLLAIMSPAERGAWFNESKLPDDDKTRLRIYLSEKYYIYDSMVKGSSYFSALSKAIGIWPDDIQDKNRIVGVLHQEINKSREGFPAGKGFKFTLKNSAGEVVFAKIYHPQDGYESSDKWKTNILSQIQADMLLQDERNRISVSHIEQALSSNPKIGSGASDDDLNVFVINEHSLVESANFEFVDSEGSIEKNTSASTASSSDISVHKQLSVNEQLDSILLKSAASQGMTFAQADLDAEYSVTFEKLTNNNYGSANFIAPTQKLYIKKYKLRDILSGNLYRDEDFTLNSVSDVNNVSGISGMSQDVLRKIINHVEREIKEKIEALKSSSPLRSAVSVIYQKAINTALLKFLLTPKNDDVTALVNDYLSGKAALQTVSVNMPWEALGMEISDAQHPVSEMMAITKGDLKIIISLRSGKCYIMRAGMVPGRELAIDIQNSLSKKDRDGIIPGYKPWLSWSLSYGNVTNNTQTLLDSLYNGLIDRLSSDLDYDIFTPGEHKTKRLVSYGQAVLRGIALVAGAAAATASGQVQVAALLVSALAESGDIGLSVLKLYNSDRGKEFIEAKADILVGSILFAVFSVADVKGLLRYATSNHQEFITLVRKSNEFVDKIKYAPNADEIISRGISDANIRADYSRQVLDEGFIEGVITEGRHNELMAGVDTSSTISSRAGSSDGTSLSSSHSVNTGGSNNPSVDLSHSSETSSSGYQSGSSKAGTTSHGGQQTQSLASGSRSSVGGGHVNSGAQTSNGATRMEQLRADVNNLLDRFRNSDFATTEGIRKPTGQTSTVRTNNEHSARLPLDVRGGVRPGLGESAYNQPLTGAVRRNPNPDGTYGIGTQGDLTWELNGGTPNSNPWPGARGIDEGRRLFNKQDVIRNGKSYGYRQYDGYKIYLPEGKDARPGRFMVSGHGNTIATNTVACPKKTTINFYGEHGKLLDDNGLESRKMLPSARVRYNELDQPVTEVPIINNGEIESWRTATLEERIKFTGTSKAGHYKDVNLSHFEDDNPYRAMDMWDLEKQAGTQNPALVPATPRPGGLATIDKNKSLKLSTLVEDFASVSSTGEAVVDVNACRGGWLASLFANKNMRAGASNRYVRARPSRRYTEQNGIRSIGRTQNRTGGRLLKKGDLTNTLSPIGTGGSAILQIARDDPKTTLKVLGFAFVTGIEASAVAVGIMYLRGDFDSPDATTNGQRPDTEPVSRASTEEPTLTLTKDEVSERLSFIISKVASLMGVLLNNDDNALAQLRPLEKLFFGDDDYLDVHDLTQILAFFDAIKNDTTGESLKAFLEGKPTPWEIENPDNPFARLGRENVIGFLFQVLR